jgi:hypothetical protein
MSTGEHLMGKEGEWPYIFLPRTRVRLKFFYRFEAQTKRHQFCMRFASGSEQIFASSFPGFASKRKITKNTKFSASNFRVSLPSKKLLKFFASYLPICFKAEK